ncbi:MAG TPA: TIGR02281 family clan AA aspartic protease [Burkholderiales bacterium]
MLRIIALFLLLAGGAAWAAEVALVGVIGDKAAVVAVDGGEPKTIKVGQTWRGITVLSVERERATLEIDGKQRVLQRGVHYRSDGATSASSRQSATLAADTRGHFIAEGQINGGHIRFLIDTGATAVAIPAADAVRLGIDYRSGSRITMQTANGNAPAFVTRLDRVRVGAIELLNVDAIVVENGLNVALLGMSFLNRVEMKRDGTTMVLTRQF